MVRPVQISNEQILEAAQRVFLDHGYAASTALVAQQAGVSEGSIFKRFATKDGLFVAAMSRNLTSLDFKARVGQGSLEQNLEELVLQLIGHFREMLPRMMMLWAHTNPMEAFAAMDEPPPVLLRRKLTEYLSAEQEAGRLSAQDPEVLARVLTASTHSYVFMECVGANQPAQLAAEDYAREVVRLIWNGVSGAKT